MIVERDSYDDLLLQECKKLAAKVSTEEKFRAHTLEWQIHHSTQAALQFAAAKVTAEHPLEYECKTCNRIIKGEFGNA